MITTFGEFRPDLRAKYREIDALNISTLKHGLKSMAHVNAAMVGTKDEPTPQMALGTALHARLLRPTEYDELIVVAPNVDRRTKEGKAAWEKFVHEAAGKTVITVEQAGQVAVMEHALRSDPETADVLRGLTHVEMPMFWGEACRGSTVAAKGQVDGFRETDGLLIDVKTCASAHPKAVEQAVHNYGYHLQAEWYERGIKACAGVDPQPMLFVFVESVEPYLTLLVRLDPETRAIARVQVDELLARFQACRQHDLWPGYGSGVQTLGLPLWARKQFEEAPNTTGGSVVIDGGGW
jgi:hypothetical protein